MKKPPLKRFPDGYKGRKAVLSQAEIEELLTGWFIVEEKLDGSLVVKEYDGMFLMLEDMKYVHTVFYDKLPGRYILVDVCKGNERLKHMDRRDLSKRLGYPLPPLLHFEREHEFEPETIHQELFRRYEPKTSKFGHEWSEGFVVKSEENLTLGGKYSRLDLTDAERYETNRLNQIRGQ